MLRKEAEREIIREWMSLPEGERQNRASSCAVRLEDEAQVSLQYTGSDRYQEIRRKMLRHHKRINDAENVIQFRS